MVLATKGIMFFVGGNNALIALGKVLSIIGITSWPLHFGWAMAMIYIVGGITFAVGAFFRISTFSLGTIVLLETTFKYSTNRPFMDDVAYALVLAATMYGFMFIGPGTYAAGD
jgi:hypothetical protein